ncbi:MAG: PD-(D/E)XK nuclease family protein [Candidatus Aminicenantes bacterium]|nr:PD-(D/E)XK nuclease family protein [Candidatus Aminicenantes bacterium]
MPASPKNSSSYKKNTTLSFLADFCSQHLLDEKILIVPSYQKGRQIGESLTKAGHSWVNLRFATLPSLAHEVCAEEIARAKLKQITPYTTSLLVEKAFTNLKQYGHLDYFKALDAKPGIIKAFSRSIQILRMQGISSKSLSPQEFANRFINKKKGTEIHLLLSEYEKLLQDKKLLDKPGLYLKACKSFPQNFAHNKYFLCFEDQALTPLEKKFLHKISQDNLIILPGNPVFGIQKPRRFHKVTEPEKAPEQPAADSERAAWLFAPYKAPEPLNDGTLTITTAVGPSNECKEVFRLILQDKIPVDETEIICPQGQVYPSLFFTLSQKTGIPITLGEGLGIGFTSPGKLFSFLLNWMESDFRDSIFRDLLESGHLSFKKKDKSFPSPHQISALLKRAGIGWGKKRYLTCLERLKEEAAGPSIRHLNQIKPEIKKIFRFLDAWNGREPIDFQNLARGIHDFLAQYASVKTPQDAEAVSALYSRLDELASFDTPPMEKEDALERLRSLETDIKVGSSGPAPGHAHISAYRSGGFAARPHTFILGLNRENFPGTGFQDPILLDEEREKLSPSLRTTRDSLRENLFSMARLISSLRGKIHLSYSCYDILGERESFPSSLVLQAFRLIKGKPRLDYSDLMNSFKETQGFFPSQEEKTLDSTEWWLEKIVKDQGLLNGINAVKVNFPSLGQGIKALTQRKSLLSSPFPYEGVIFPREKSSEKTPRPLLSIEKTVFSASRLECLAFCPFKYFMEYVLGVRKPEIIEYDPSRWLDPLNWGTLVHEVLFKFMTEIKKRGEKPQKDKHRTLIRDIAEKLIQSFKQKIPPPSEDVFLLQKNELMQALDIFLEVESKRDEEIEPILFEVGFGTGTGKGDGTDTPVFIEITPKTSILLKGRIDRIDRLGEGLYRVIDYKSGRSSSYERIKYFGRGRILQHALYSLAAEKILKTLGRDPSPTVKEGAYYFPTRKGEGREITFTDFDRLKFRLLLTELLAVIITGNFVPHPDAICEYCDLAPLCGDASSRAKEKKNLGVEEYSIFERLKDFD